MCIMVPLLLAYDVAHTSARCDALMDRLNAVRMESGEAYHIRLEWLELSLKNLNRGQGLGFVSRRNFKNYQLAMMSGDESLGCLGQA